MTYEEELETELELLGEEHHQEIVKITELFFAALDLLVKYDVPVTRNDHTTIYHSLEGRREKFHKEATCRK